MKKTKKETHLAISTATNGDFDGGLILEITSKGRTKLKKQFDHASITTSPQSSEEHSATGTRTSLRRMRTEREKERERERKREKEREIPEATCGRR